MGGLLLARSLTSPLLQRLPVTPAIIYLAVGLLVGPTVLNLFHFNPFQQSLERLSELMLVLLIGGTLFLDSWSWRRGSRYSCLW